MDKSELHSEIFRQVLSKGLIFCFLRREVFYVRNHLPVPHIDPDEYELEVAGIGVQETKLTLDDLKTKFPKVSITATIMCAGNRRSDMTKVSVLEPKRW